MQAAPGRWSAALDGTTLETKKAPASRKETRNGVTRSDWRRRGGSPGHRMPWPEAYL
jgi:hypothetical protein